MAAGMLDERAALVALLRARPDGITWGQITADVLEAGSAVEVWERLTPPSLLSLPEEFDAPRGCGP
jgi:DNA processing protein